MMKEMKCEFNDMANGQYFRTEPSEEGCVFEKLCDADPNKLDGWGKYRYVNYNAEEFECMEDKTVYPCDNTGNPLPEEMGLWARIQYCNEHGFYPPMKDSILRKLKPINIRPTVNKSEIWLSGEVMVTIPKEVIMSLNKTCTLVTDIAGAAYMEHILKDYD